MLLAPKKKLATIIVGSMKPDFVQKMGEKREDKPIDLDSKSEEKSDDPKVYAMEKFTDALSAKDHKKMAEALKEFVVMCSPDYDSESYQGDDE